MIAYQTLNRRLSTLLAAALLVACSGGGQSFDLGDPNAVTEPMAGWSARACKGEAPLICISGPKGETGLVELLQFPTDHASLQVLAEDFVASMATDRAAGCGDGYVIEAIPPTDAVVAGEEGVRFGYVGRTTDGALSERNVEHAILRDGQVTLLTAAAYAEGGCPGRDELDSFEPGALASFDEGLTSLVATLVVP